MKKKSIEKIQLFLMELMCFKITQLLNIKKIRLECAFLISIHKNLPL